VVIVFVRGIKLKQLLEILRLSLDNGFSERNISKLVGISKTTVHNYLVLFSASGLPWPLPVEYLNEEILSKKLNAQYQSNVAPRLDFVEIHHELLSDKKVTLLLLWEEAQLKKEMPYSYAHFARLYREWLKSQPSVMRQRHKAGEKVFVDYSGDRVPLYDAEGNITSHAEIFVGVLGCSNYIYMEATLSQKVIDWSMSHVRMFEYFGGVPELVITDNLKSGVSKANRYDPVITPAFYEMLGHYRTAAMPARVYTPKDKAKVENGVLIIQRWVLARLRKLKFTNLTDLNDYIRELLIIANNKKLQKYPYSRSELFCKLDKPALTNLPVQRYCHRDYKKVRVGADYHVELLGHYYSVPYTLVKEELDVWYTDNMVECYHDGRCVAKHIRSYEEMTNTTVVVHMPIAHQKQAEMTPQRVVELASEIGMATALIVENIIQGAKHPAIGCRQSYGFLRLAKEYGEPRLEQVCIYAINIGIYDYKNIQILLEHNLIPENNQHLCHRNIRGAEYYC
jgi:transposase